MFRGLHLKVRIRVGVRVRVRVRVSVSVRVTVRVRVRVRGSAGLREVLLQEVLAAHCLCYRNSPAAATVP